MQGRVRWVFGRKRDRVSRIEVDHKDVVEEGFENGNESLVVRMREVYRACPLVFEGHDKAVGESFVEPFGAIVLAPFERPDAGNLSFQGGEFPFDFSDRCGIGIFFELKAHDVTDALFRGSLVACWLLFIGWFCG